MAAKRVRLLVHFLCWAICLTYCYAVKAQSNITCPVNIGFEDGTFQNWVCASGGVATDGTMTLFPGPPSWNQHSIVENVNNVLDPYGLFPKICPNGSGYSIQLGNESTGAEAERVSYTFTIPQSQDNYSIIFNYAVVLENPNHLDFEQPKFMVEIFDVATNDYVNCASFQFVAASNLPGFEPSTVKPGVFYKDWAPVVINLGGYAGKTIRLEFTTADCSKGGHFGYAYVDVDEDCASPIKGNIYCAGATGINLIAPAGFQAYQWYNENFTQVLGTSNTLAFTPPPPNNTVFALVAIPYPGLGCLDTMYTTINSSPDLLTLQVKDTVRGCVNPGVDITLPSVTLGSTPGLNYSYHSDPLGTAFISGGPKFIKTPGTYYINATNGAGCRDIKPVYVAVSPAPGFTVQSNLTGCSAGVDLTNPAHILSADPGLQYTYSLDSTGNMPVTNPTSVGAGLYYIRGSNGGGCGVAQPVTVFIQQMQVTNQSACNAVNLTSPSVTSGSSSGFTYQYWIDNAATQPLTNPQQVGTAGTYYIQGQHSSGCREIKPVQVSILPPPAFAVITPPAVNYPTTVNLYTTITNGGNETFSFWKDSAATDPLPNPQALNRAGTYYIRGRTAQGCTAIRPVVVNVIPPPPFQVDAPNAFSPNGDGVNDVFRMKIDGIIKVNGFRVYNRWGQEVYFSRNQDLYWDGRSAGKPLPLATYYWILEGEDMYLKKPVTAQGSITIIR